MPFGTTGVTISFLSCEVNGETILTCDDIYNQPSYHAVETSVTLPDLKCKVENGNVTYDRQGRQLQGRPAKGLYIENGRKRGVK